jgi:hypothetical protein
MIHSLNHYSIVLNGDKMEERSDEKMVKRPISYNPSCRRYIYIDDVFAGKEKIIPIDKLSRKDQKKLVIKRLKAENPMTKSQPMTGFSLTRDELIQAVKNDEPYGKMQLDMQLNYLENFLGAIQSYLESNPESPDMEEFLNEFYPKYQT